MWGVGFGVSGLWVGIRGFGRGERNAFKSLGFSGSSAWASAGASVMPPAA